MQNAHPLMTLRQLMELLGVKARATIYSRLASDPGFPRPLRRALPGHHLRWRRADVETYLAGLAQASDSGIADLV